MGDISYIDKKQIRDFSSPTGVYTPTGWLVSGNLTLSGLISGLSGYFNNLTVQNLSVSGAVISPYLSGILGTTVTGSGIFVTLSPVDVSGNNIHFYHYLYTNNPSSPIQSFSSQDSQTDWAYFNNGAWANFPAIGLNSTLQQASIVKHVFKPTGMDVFTRYFSEYKVIYAGNVTGAPANSIQFQSPTPGFTAAHIPFLAEYFSTADSRYARKAQIGTDFVLSGVKVSGIPLIVQNFSTIPATNHGTGTLIDVSGSLYVWDVEIGFTGYRPVTIFTGLSVPSGGVITSANPIFSGQGGIITSLLANNIVVISGSVSQFAAASNPIVQGVSIFSGSGNLVARQSTLSSGTLISFAGGVNSFALAQGTPRQGDIIISGGSNITITETLTSSGSIYSISGSAGGGSAAGNVTGIGVNNQSVLSTGGFRFSGAGITTVTSGSIVNGVTTIIISGSGGSSSAGGVGNVTGFGVADSLQFTGGFVVSGLDKISTFITSAAPGISGIIISLDYDQIFLEMWNQIGY